MRYQKAAIFNIIIAIFMQSLIDYTNDWFVWQSVADNDR